MFIKKLKDQVPTLVITLGLCLITTFAQAERAVVLELDQVQVSETKPNGKRWDFGLGNISKPDLVLKVYLGQEELITTKKCQDAFKCTFNRRIPILIQGSQDLSITVIDQDLKRDDVVDQLTMTLKEEELGQTQEVKLVGKSTTLLTFKIRPLNAQNTTTSTTQSITTQTPTENAQPNSQN